MTKRKSTHGCGQCGSPEALCNFCHNCKDHCSCGRDLFDADELGLDPETDNSPSAGSRHA